MFRRRETQATLNGRSATYAVIYPITYSLSRLYGSYELSVKGQGVMVMQAHLNCPVLSIVYQKRQ